MSDDIFIGIGGNLLPDGYSDLHSAFSAAVDSLGQQVTLCACSPWYVTAPVPVSDQPDFLNAVLKIQTAVSPHELLDILLDTEARFGRVRSVRNAARKLDLDILAWGTQLINDDRLSVPHPRLAERAFVLLPWRDIAPDWVHPVCGKTIADLAEQDQITAQEIRRYSDPL